VRTIAALAGAAMVAALAGCREDEPAKLVPGETVTLRGEIAAGAECPMLVVTHELRVATRVVAPGRRFALGGDLGRFQVGDRVCVRGTVAAMSFCMAGEATIAIVAIAPEDSCR
jgi:hypothetical protein